MLGEIQSSALLRATYDDVARDLQSLRFDAGDVPYAEIVRRIAQYRERNGVSAPLSRPARTTVYDAFRLGRTRVNPTLVGEIARALGAPESGVAQWEMRCLEVRRQCEQNHLPELASELPHAATPSDFRSTAELIAMRVGRRAAIMLVLACIGINVLGFSLVPLLGLSLYLDMVGTAIAALALGPWYGVLVGVTTNAIGLSVTGSSSTAFALVQIAGALVWGYGVRRFRLNQSISRFVLLNAVVALVCTIVSTTLLIAVFGGSTGHASESTTETLMVMGESPAMAVFTSNLMYSLVDKFIAGLAVLVVLTYIRRWFDVPFHATLVPGPLLHTEPKRAG